MFSVAIRNTCLSSCTRKLLWTSSFLRKNEQISSKYIQGQSPKPGIREYFYFIDHQGMLYLDDARIKNFTSCFKEMQFLMFFFKQLRLNETERYPDFPYLSPCGRERNYVRCDDLPIVFTSLKEQNGNPKLVYNNCRDEYCVPFEPSEIYMGSSGRIYHPGPEQLHGIGLIKSQLAIEMSKCFLFDGDTPTHFTFNGKVFPLKNSLQRNLVQLGRQE